MKTSILIGLTLGVSLLTFSGVSAAIPNSNEGATCVVITEQLGLDSAGSQVVMLQKFLGFETFSLLGDSGYGYFGANTQGLLKDFQASNGIPVTGVVDGPTREMIKKMSCAPKVTGTTSGTVPPQKTPSTTGVTQAFSATASYRGKVLDEQKNPLSGVVVELETQRLGFQPIYNSKHQVTTKTDGTYSFTGAQSSQVYQTLTFKKEGYILDKVALTHGADLKQADFVLRKVGSSAVTYHWESSPTGILPSPRPPTCNPVPVVGSACTAQSSGCISGGYGYTCVITPQAKAQATSAVGTSVNVHLVTPSKPSTNFISETIETIFGWFK